MISLIKNLFNLEEDAPTAVLDPITAAQALLFEVIWADHDIDPAEVAVMQRLLAETFEVSEVEIQCLTDKARALHDNAVGLHEFTTALNGHMNADAKYQVVLAMWKVAFADKSLDVLEEHIIRRAADLLYVPHKDFIRAKFAAKTP
jgi:uncharacterized tellurite resistance protein B-like protein